MGVMECWVTTAYDDASALKALVLAKSLRKVATTRRLAVIFCQDLSQKLKNALLSSFDDCLKLETLNELNGVPTEFYARAYCWNLPFIRKCVYLHPNTLVLKNCDELFDQSGVRAYVEGVGIDTSVIVLEPSITTYEKLIRWMKDGKPHGTEGGTYQRYSNWIQEQHGFQPLAEKYNVKLVLGEKSIAAMETSVSIVQFCNSHPLDMSVNKRASVHGILEKATLEYYLNLYNGSELQRTLEGNALDVERYALPTVPQSLIGNEPIAIIGMSFRFPMCDNADEYWDILFNGKDCIRKVPEDRWPSATSEESREIQAGFLKCPVDEFDGKFFNVSNAELTHVDPQQRLLLEVTWEALEDAGINPQSLKGTNTGVFVGTWTQDYRELIRDVQGMNTDFHRTYMGNSLGGSGGRLSFLLGLTGPNIATESGCSSGMAAVYLACESLRKGRSDVALAAGANLLLYPFQKKHMVNVVSPDGRCKTFDEKADGFGRAEGVATLVLKKYSDAIKNGDNVLALIRGCGISQEGLSRSFGTPTKEVQEIAMKTALADAGLDATDISYVEAHGTGTVVGDPIEMAAIASVYCKNVPREKPLLVASGKTNIGHAESCSGFAGIIKVILAMKNQVIPPHLHLQSLNPYIQLDNLPLEIPTSPKTWESTPGKPRIAGVSSFGITGTDAHVIIQEAPEYTPAKLTLDIAERPHHLFTFSGKSEQALSDVLTHFANFVEKTPEIDLANAAFTLNSGRAHFMHRVGIVTTNSSDLMKKLKGASKQSKLVPESEPKLCFLFTGQGSQYPGMARGLYETNAVFKLNFDLCDRILQDMFQISIKSVIWSSGENENSLLHRTLYSQTSIFCVEYCLMKLWESWGIKPDAVMGHSLGEFAACVCAGILDLKGAITLVAERSRLIEGLCPGKMVVIKADEKKVNSLLSEFLHNNNSYWLDYAAVNSEEQTVLAGPPQAVDAFAVFCTERNLKTHVLDATNAFHSRDMDAITPEFEKIARGVNFGNATCTYISGLKGRVCEAEEINPDYWVQHTRDSVRFMSACKAAYDSGSRLFLEVGPQPVLCALAMANLSSHPGSDAEPITVLPSLRRKEDEWITILGTLTKLYQFGFQIDWNGFDQYYNRQRISLPKYPFSRKKHWYETKDSKNGLQLTGKLLHPLLGCQIPNATTTSIFQSAVEVEKLAYLKDHGIGGQIVFPAAGYLELALKSGNISTIGEMDANENLMNPISIEKMTIEAPLGLNEKESCHLQTIVVKTESEENKVSIYTQQRSASQPNGSASSSIKWTRQASGTFVPLQASMARIENAESFESIQSRCSEKIETAEFYEKLNSVGLEFGETFRSLRCLWKGKENENELLTEVIYPNMQEGNNKYYICHPVVLDALIQTIMFGMGRVKETLFVPVVIEKLVIFSKLDFSKEGEAVPKLWAHCKWDPNQQVHERSATLYDQAGKIVAIMTGVQMIETSTDVILKTLSNQQLALPDMYEEVWRAKSGPLRNRVKLDSLHPDGDNNEVDVSLNVLNDKEKASVQRRDILIFNYILKAFYALGWKPKVGDELYAKDILESLKITSNNELLVQRFLRIFREEGLVDGNSKLIRSPPAEGEVDLVIQKIDKESQEVGETVDFQVIQTCGRKLSQILSGKISALSVLYGEDNDVGAETYYNNCVMLPKFFNQLQNVFKKILKRHSELPEEERGVIRVLEIGAGTGSSTKIVLPVFEEFGAKFQYTFTDISPAFFGKAEGLFETYGRKMQYKVLNIEEDPLGQGFIPQHYDIVFASNVLHATRDITESLRNSRILLKDNGYFVLAETLKEIRDYDVIFGLLDGYWRFTDRSLRPNYPTIDATIWKRLCLEEGFQNVNEHLCFNGRLGVIAGRATNKFAAQATQEKTKWWMVFASKEIYQNHLEARLRKLGRNAILVSQPKNATKNGLVQVGTHHFELRPQQKEDVKSLFDQMKENDMHLEGILYLWGLDTGSEKDHLKQTHALLFLAQTLLSDFKGLPRLVVATEGIIRVEDESETDISPATLWGMAKSFRTEHFNLHVKSVDLDPDEQNENMKYDELLTEMWNDDQEFQVCYRQRYRHVARLTTCKDFASPLLLPKCERFSLALPPTKNIADLKYCPNGKPTMKENQIEIKVRAYGLNFRDIFTVLKPNEEFEKWNTVGLEFSGTVVAVGQNVTTRKIGDLVIGCNFSEGALPSHLCMDEDMVFEMPEDITFCEAATIPAAFATAYYCLVTIAGLKKGENVLVHAGSGGVGLFALQVARAVGANVIATAGSRRKRQFLRNLGIEHVFHSRNTDYGHQIPKVTGGKGIQVVLNSLTSPGFKEATLGCCSLGARFVEMSKLHIWSEEEVQNLRPDVEYTIVDLTKVEKVTWKSIWGAIREYLDGGHLKPVHFIQYDAACIREALTYMQKAKHIGKIIITMPCMEQKEAELVPVNNLFSDRATYLLTGGLGGIGMELAKWMCAHGAKHMVVTSRRPADERAIKIINDLNSKGFNVIARSLDVGDFNQCKALLDEINSQLPRLRGIFHLAGALADATYTNQTLDMYAQTFQGKVYGAVNLHNLTKDTPLEFFMLFSSMASIFGPIGQSNYAGANMFLDALAHYRHSIGLCGQSINWGQWGDVGLSKDIKIPALRPFSPAQAFSALEIVMRSQKNQVSVLDVDFSVVRKLTANIGSYLEELKITKEANSVALDVKINNFWQDFDGAEDDDGREEVIKSYVCNILRQILKLDDDEAIDENQKFSEMGMDSLMMLEMKNFIQTMLGKNITMNVSELAELTTVNKLASHLMGLIKANREDGGEKQEKNSYNHFTNSQKELIEQDLVLPEQVKATGATSCKRSEIKTVLLTGSTGKLGPYMLEALANRPLDRIFCLIRSKDDASAHDRLVKVLEEKNLRDIIDQGKIECVAGDITEEKFGLPAEKYLALASKIDGVVHCAVKGNLMEPYKKRSGGNCSNDLRSVNVVGTINALDFCCAGGRTKPFLHASTLLACHKVTPDGLLLEDWCQKEDIYDMPNVGYPVSKFICEYLALQALQRGVPVHVHRFPGLLGDKNGCFSFPNNHAMLRLLGFCKLGVMPANPIPLQLLDVDYAADLSCELFFNDDAPSDVYNITNPHMCMLQDFPTLADNEFGFPIDIVDYKDFFLRLNENDEYAQLFPYREVDFEGDRFVDFTASPVALQSWINNPQDFFVSRKLRSYLKDYEQRTKHPVDILRRDMQFAKDTNIFSKFGLKSRAKVE